MNKRIRGSPRGTFALRGNDSGTFAGNTRSRNVRIGSAWCNGDNSKFFGKIDNKFGAGAA